MAKYAVMVLMDLDVQVMDSTKPKEVEKITENRIRIALGVERRKLGITMLRTKLLGEVKDE